MRAAASSAQFRTTVATIAGVVIAAQNFIAGRAAPILAGHPDEADHGPQIDKNEHFEMDAEQHLDPQRLKEKYRHNDNNIRNPDGYDFLSLFLKEIRNVLISVIDC